jgi:hypothetical protein
MGAPDCRATGRAAPLTPLPCHEVAGDIHGGAGGSSNSGPSFLPFTFAETGEPRADVRPPLLDFFSWNTRLEKGRREATMIETGYGVF